MKTCFASVRGLVVCCVLLAAQVGMASVLGIDSTVTTPALPNASKVEAEITSFTVGTETYSDLIFLEATAVANTSQPFVAAGNTPPTLLADILGLLSSPYITQGKANAGWVEYAIGASMDGSDDTPFFMYELNLTGTDGDAVTVTPLDSGGAAIGDWTLPIASSDYGPQTSAVNISLISGTNSRGVTFTLADFTGTGTLSGVEGLRFTSGGLDPLAVGMVVVPEPNTLALLLMAAAALALAVRHHAA